MSKALTVTILFLIPACSPLLRAQENPYPQPFSPDQLDNLLAPIALYPDPLLAQILPAATFPDQIDEAARFCRGGASSDDIDTQPWDVSVKAVAHYPAVLYMMADGLDWTTALGQAYVNQNDDVMASIQRLRQEARDAGNLASTPQQDVEVDDGYIEIWPEQPQFCYIPFYDPTLVYFGSGGVFGGPIVTFSAGYPIGVWLNRQFDWPHRHIYYHGWADRRGWIGRSLPYVHVNNIYVNNKLKNVTIGRGVTTRPVNYGNLARYDAVHRNVVYGNAAPGGGINNKIIERNTNVSDTRINDYRGRVPAPAAPAAAPMRKPEQTGNAAFGGTRSNFDVKVASERGQSSRSSRPAPAPKSSSGGGSHSGGGGGSHGGGGGGGSHGGGGGGSHGGGGGHH